MLFDVMANTDDSRTCVQLKLAILMFVEDDVKILVELCLVPMVLLTELL